MPFRVLLLVMGLCVWPHVAVTDRLERAYWQCQEGMEDTSEPEKTIEACSHLLDSGSLPSVDLKFAYGSRGAAYLVTENYEAAIADFTELIRRSPVKAEAFKFRGDAYYGAGIYDRAIADYSHVIEYGHLRTEGFVRRCQAHFANGQVEHALADCGIATRRYPKTVTAFLVRGGIFMSTGAYEEALMDFDEASRLEPDSWLAWLRRGDANYEMGQYERAISDYQRAVHLNPNARNLNAWAWSLYLASQYGRALVEIERSLALEPDNPAAIDTRAHVLAALGRTDEALTNFRRALEIADPESIAFYQEALVGHGYTVKVDGVYGPEMRQALKACIESGCRLLK